jgi:hypothetical protein
MSSITKYGVALRNAGGVWRRVRYIAMAAASGALLLAGPICASAQGQTLQQGIDVIRQALAKDGLYERVTTTTRGNYKSSTQRKFSLSEAKGCSLVVVADSHIHTELPQKNRVTDRRWSDIYRPDFTTMDPATATVIAPEPPQANWETKGYLVRISIETGKSLMVSSTLDPATNQARDLPGVPTLAVYVTNKDTADRLAKAFAQVAAACRANPAGE